MRRDLNLNTVTLWAMWYTKYGPTTMQGWKGCDQLQTNQTITLTDARDNNQYTVAKFSNGKCWMTKNLLVSNYLATKEDSDVSNTFNIPPSSGPNFNSYDTAQVYLNSISSNYGAHYNYYAITGGEGKNMSSGNVQYSICPKGWRLPTVDELNYYPSTWDRLTVQSPPASLTPNAGYYVGSGWTHELRGAGCYTQYWSSTLVNGNVAYILHFCYNSSYCTDGGSYGTKNNGNVARCIFRG